MTIRAMNWAWGVKLQPSVKLVLLKLADRANDDGECWPGQSSIADECCISKNTLIRHLKDLESAGLITKIKRKAEDGRQAPNVYQLHLDREPGANLAPGETPEPGAKSDENRVPMVAPDKELKFFIEPTYETTDATTKVAAPVLIVEDPVRIIDGRWVIDDAVVDRWVIAYQAGRTNEQTEDWIEAELAKAALWLKANPRKRKKNLLRFLSSWLTRASQPPPRRTTRPAQRAYH